MGHCHSTCFTIMCNISHIRFMIELPAALKPIRTVESLIRVLRNLEIITFYQRMTLIACLFLWNQYLLWHPVMFSHNRICMLPFHRNQHRNPPYCPSILKEHTIPLPIRCIHNSPLCYALPVIPHIIIEYIASCELSCQRVRHETGLRPFPVIS